MGKGEINTIKNQGIGKAQGIPYPLSKRLYTLPEAGLYLGRTVWSMRELVWKGHLPIVRDGRRVFIDVSDLDLYISKHKMIYP